MSQLWVGQDLVHVEQLSKEHICTLLDLTKKGYTVYPVNKKEKQIEGLKAYKIQKKQMSAILEYENDINTLKSEITEIRATLEVIVNKIK